MGNVSLKLEVMATLAARFGRNPVRHPGVRWDAVEARLRDDGAKTLALAWMEASGGEPDVMEFGDGGIVFVDCAAESPKARRSLCYDGAALEARKENKPEGSAMGMAASMGVEILDEEGYRALQGLGEFDLKTSSWLRTPDDVRAQGGAIFGDRRYGRVFVFHNGADSYYASRGWRGMLRGVRSWTALATLGRA